MTCQPRRAPGWSIPRLLTAQGKYLADFFLLNWGDDILLDIKTDIAAKTLRSG
jgi:folate-binding Fe-S cluster repair protein YgfZ